MSQIISDHQNPSVNVAVSSMCSILPNLKSENSWICVCNEFDVTRSQTGRSRYPETENSRIPDNSMLNRYEGHQKLWNIFQFDEYFVLTLLTFHEVSEIEPILVVFIRTRLIVELTIHDLKQFSCSNSGV